MKQTSLVMVLLIGGYHGINSTLIINLSIDNEMVISGVFEHSN